jgi:hypothetical protein
MDFEALADVEPAVDAVTEGVVEAQMAAAVEGRAPERPWAIMSLRQADWVLERVADLEVARREYEGEVARWRDGVLRLERAESWLRERLKVWGRANRTAQRKTFTLAHGTVATREGRDRVRVDDEAAAVAWAKVHCPDAVKVEERFLPSHCPHLIAIADRREVVGETMIDLDTGEIQPIRRLVVVDRDGNPIPGLGVEPGEVTVTVTPLGA